MELQLPKGILDGLQPMKLDQGQNLKKILYFIYSYYFFHNEPHINGHMSHMHVEPKKTGAYIWRLHS